MAERAKQAPESSKARRPKGLGGGPYEKRNKLGKLTGYWGLVDLGLKPDGQRDRRRVNGKTKREWEENREALKRDHDAGALPAPNRETVGVYLDRWLAEIEPPKGKLKVRAWGFYADNVRLYLKPGLGNVVLTKLTVGQVNGLWTDLLARQPKPLAGKTVKGVRATLVAGLKAAVKAGRLKVSVAALSDVPEVAVYEPETLEEDELRHFQSVVAGHPLGAFFLVMSTTGCRIGEVLGLRERDLDPVNGDIRIEVAVRTRGTPALDTPKSRNGSRTVPLLPFVYEAVRQYLADHDFERRRNAEAREVVQREMGVPGDTLFTQANGMWVSYAHVDRELRKVFGTARLPRLTPHGFRHTAGTLLEQRGVSYKAIAEMLGHADAAFTARTYIHVNDAMRRRVKDEIAAISQR